MLIYVAEILSLAMSTDCNTLLKNFIMKTGKFWTVKVFDSITTGLLNNTAKVSDEILELLINTNYCKFRMSGDKVTALKSKIDSD